MKLLAIIILLIGIGWITGCKKYGKEVQAKSLTIKLHECAVVSFYGNTMRVCFDSIISDSRCPANVMCVWQGEASCRFSLRKTFEVYTATLSTISQGTFKNEATLPGFKIELVMLSPYPGLPPVPPPGNEIRAEVKITAL